ncbi:MAG: tripartite tricarboxylate transporter permease [Candidatus Diapherotrites archaeon]
MVEEFFWLFFGIIVGVFSGLVPGLHSNSVSLLLVYLFSGDSLNFAIFVVALCITHSIVEIIPSMLTGAAEDSTINLLPGQELLLSGRGFEAIYFSIVGVVCTLFVSVFLLPVLFSFTTYFSWIIDFFLLPIIFVVLFLLIFHEKNFFGALIVAFSSGFIGLTLINSGIKEIVFSLVTGFFAVPALFYSSKTINLPRQKICYPDLFDFRFGALTSLLSCFLSVVPAFGPAHASSLLGVFYRKLSKTEYLLLSGGIGVSNLLFGVLVLYTLNKTRSGMTVIISSIVDLSFSELLILLSVAFCAAGFACLITLFIAKFVLLKIHDLNYGFLSVIILAFVFLLVFLFSGFFGLVACFIASLVGNYCLKKKVSRSLCMCFLLFPTLVFYLGF